MKTNKGNIYLFEFHNHKKFNFKIFENGWIWTTPFFHLFKITTDEKEFIKTVSKILRGDKIKNSKNKEVK